MIIVATWAAILAALTVAVHTAGFALLWQVVIKPARGGDTISGTSPGCSSA
ncbi:MAG: hypothetical protein M0C28_16675 [Candidatus Moduliflexus flocculans]|nr:hypothetical protein [Candidatus Moduliflexus flocculans]